MIDYEMISNSKTTVIDREMLYRIKDDGNEEAAEKVIRFLTEHILLRRDYAERLISKKIIIPTRVRYCSNFVVQNKEETYMETHGTNLDWPKYYHVVEFVPKADYPFWIFDPEKDLFGHGDGPVEKAYVVKGALEALVLYQIHLRSGIKTRNIYVSAAAGIPEDLDAYIVGHYGAKSVIAYKNPSAEVLEIFKEKEEEPESDFYTIDYVKSVQPEKPRRLL